MRRRVGAEPDAEREEGADLYATHTGSQHE